MMEYRARQPTKPRQLKVAEKPAAKGDRSRHKSIPYKIGKDMEEVKNQRKYSNGVRSRFFFGPGMRSPVILNLLHIGTIGRKHASCDYPRRKANAAGPRLVAVLINSAKTGGLVEFFTGDIRVINVPFMLDLFVATPPAAAAFFFPAF
jgi:hypothetical protein